jgi:hypothetical protein
LCLSCVLRHVVLRRVAVCHVVLCFA